TGARPAVVVALEHADQLPGRNVPDTRVLVVGGRQHPLAVRAEGCEVHLVGVALENTDLLALLDVPDPCGLILRSRHHELPVRTEGGEIDLVRVPAEYDQLLAGLPFHAALRVRYARCAVERAGEDGAAVGTEHGARYRAVVAVDDADLLESRHVPDPRRAVERRRHRIPVVRAEEGGPDLIGMALEHADLLEGLGVP